MRDLFDAKLGIVKRFPKLWLGLFLVSCHPEGCYGPRAFDYNTKGATPAALVGTYRLEKGRGEPRKAQGEDTGFIRLEPDMTFETVNIPEESLAPGTAQKIPANSATGQWRVIKTKAIWEVELLRQKPNGDYGSWKQFPIIGQKPPHGIELSIDHDRGEWVRYRQDTSN